MTTATPENLQDMLLPEFELVIELCTGDKFSVYPPSRPKMVSVYVRKLTEAVMTENQNPMASMKAEEVHIRQVTMVNRRLEGGATGRIDSGTQKCWHA